MIERVVVVVETGNWFESQAAEFRDAQALIVQTGGDIDDIRRQRDALDDGTTERAICSKAIDALNRTRDLRKFAKTPYGTDIYRQQIRNAAITLLGQRAAKAAMEASRREREYLGIE